MALKLVLLSGKPIEKSDKKFYQEFNNKIKNNIKLYIRLNILNYVLFRLIFLNKLKT